MSTPAVLFLCTTLSTACLAALAYVDPKRSRRFRGTANPRLLRTAILACCFAPILWLATLGAAPVIVWLGAICVAGWLVAQVINNTKDSTKEP